MRLAHEVVQHESRRRALDERQAAERLVLLADVRPGEQRAQDRLCHSPGDGGGLECVEQCTGEVGEDGAEELRDDADGRLVGDVQVGVHPQGGRGQLEREGMTAGEAVHLRGAELVETAAAEQGEGIGLVQRPELQDPDLAGPAGPGRPYRQRLVAAGDDGYHPVGQRRQQHPPEPGVEEPHALVGVQADDGASFVGGEGDDHVVQAPLPTHAADARASRKPSGVGSISRPSRTRVRTSSAMPPSAARRSRDLPTPPGPWTKATMKGERGEAVASARAANSAVRPTKSCPAATARRSAIVFRVDGVGFTPRVRRTVLATICPR